jgi:hypothetical protein
VYGIVYNKTVDFSSTGLRKVFVRAADTLLCSIKQNTGKFGKQYGRVTKCVHPDFILQVICMLLQIVCLAVRCRHKARKSLQHVTSTACIREVQRSTLGQDTLYPEIIP